jgi:protease YdgD
MGALVPERAGEIKRLSTQRGWGYRGDRVMRFLAVAATLAACLAAGQIAQPSKAEAILSQQFQVEKYSPASKAVRRGDDSCAFAHDNECDEPGIGTGVCAAGRDFSDCRFLRDGEKDACASARDGVCDEPRFGTGACVQGSDRGDCGAIAWMRNRDDSCLTAFNNICEEPGRGRGCAARTDRSDCFGRARSLALNDHFFGHDDRVRVNAQEEPWRFMGSFINSADERCTATLVGADIIVTAAHCIHLDSGLDARGRFQPAAGGAATRAIAYLIDPGFSYANFITGEGVESLDWALLRLERPLGARLGFAGVRDLIGAGAEAARAAELYQAGYGWDTGVALAGHVGCHVAELRANGAFTHQCDTTRGDSGSAFLVRDGAGYAVVGIDSSFLANPDGPTHYVAVGAGAFLPALAAFAARRKGTAIDWDQAAH